MVVIVMTLVFIVAGLRASLLFKKEMKLLDVIFNYQLNCIKTATPYEVDFKDVKDGTDANVFFRIWDWSYTALIDKEKFEIIKPFMSCPECYGKPNTPNGMAENGCDDCKFSIRCAMLRKEKQNENC